MLLQASPGRSVDVLRETRPTYSVQVATASYRTSSRARVFTWRQVALHPPGLRSPATAAGSGARPRHLGGLSRRRRRRGVPGWQPHRRCTTDSASRSCNIAHGKAAFRAHPSPQGLRRHGARRERPDRPTGQEAGW